MTSRISYDRNTDNLFPGVANRNSKNHVTQIRVAMMALHCYDYQKALETIFLKLTLC